MKTPRCLALFALIACVNASLGQGTAFTYQGRLDNSGVPANGSYDLSFSLFNTNSNGVVVAGPITNAATPVNNGLFTVVLDFGPGVFNGASYWLDISVRTNGAGSFTALAPRQPVFAAPYAIMAGSANNLLGTLPATQLSGTIPSFNLSGTYENAVNFNNGGNAFTGDGSGLINLNASQLTSGTIPSARLPGVAFLNSNQTFTAQNIFSQGISIGNPNPWSAMAVDVLAGQANARLLTTNTIYGSVIELRNMVTNAWEYLGAINFNNSGDTYPGQIGYIAAPTNQNNDYMQFRVGGYVGLTIQADPRGLGAANIIGGYPNNSVSPIGSGGNVIAGGGYSGGPNQVLSNTAGVFIGAGSAHKIGPNLNDSAIVGGYGNTIQAWDSVIAGGANNRISTPYSAIVGGYQNTIEVGDGNGGSFIGNGYYNYIAGRNLNSSIGGGQGNTIGGNNLYSTIGGGVYNTIQGSLEGYTNSYPIAGTIAGGQGNTIDYDTYNSTIGGGAYNLVSTGAFSATIIGGMGNTAGGDYSTAAGGQQNTANGTASFAAGTYARALHDGAFVLSDSQYAYFNSTTADQLSARFHGGVRFETFGMGMTLDGQPVFTGGNYANPVNFYNPANSFIGDGSGLTSLNASQLVLGTIPGTVLSGSYPGVLTFNNAGNSFTGSFTGNGGGLTGLNASQLTSGTVPGTALGGTYTAVLTFNNAGNSFSGSGAGLTGLNASQLTTGTVPKGALSGSYTNALTFTNAANSFAGNGSGLTALSASQLTTGTLPSSALSGTYANALTLNNAANSFTGNGSGLTGLSANQLTSGTVPSAALSGTYANALTLNNAANSFTGNGSGLTGLSASQLTSGTVPSAALSGTYANALTLNNAGNSFTGNGSGLTSLNASQLASGTVPSGALSGVYTNPITMANAANVFAGSGTGVTNVNAAKLNGLTSTPTNVPSSIVQRDASGNFSAGSVTASSLTAGNVQATGLLRSGSETGTTDSPSQSGLVIRRVNSLANSVGNIIARTDLLTLERDGSNEGLLIRYPSGVGPQTINCVAQTLSGATVFFHTTLNSPASPGTIPLVTSAQHAIRAQISFGNTRFNGHVTQVTIDRFDDGTTSDNYWVGTVTSTYNQ